MGEWPKKLYAEAGGAVWKMLSERQGPHPRHRRYPFEVEVIPADLGGELYEALRSTYGQRDSDIRENKGNHLRQAALDRYEREVGHA